ncbi:hypothetical protein M9H77_19094 [Catharanthus roseus]|uniref:Uncharacterized protein n=1 Tax=Catharanthus roseus TaxID=4058 RepID=A0ACC0B9B1_CATRO|nr:hypothetical protein M9H77_19094 [Catharanthus roseus]
MQGPFHSSAPLTFQFLQVHVLTALLLMILVIVSLPAIEVSLQQYRLRFNLLSFSEAVKHDKWPISMQREIDALEQNATWTLTILPPQKKALCYKWVYQIKLKFDGTVERLVILGNT